MKHSRRTMNKSGQQTPNKMKHSSQTLNKSGLSTLNYKKDMVEEGLLNNTDNDADEINERENQELFNKHVEKMKKVNQIAKSLKGHVKVNQIAKSLYGYDSKDVDLNVDVKTVAGSGTKFKDSFGQDLTVPCIPSQLPDGNLNQCKNQQSAQRDISNYHDIEERSQQSRTSNRETAENSKKDGFIIRKDKDGNIIDNHLNNSNNQDYDESRSQQERVSYRQNTHGKDSKRDGFIIRKDKDGSKTIIDEDGIRYIPEKQEEDVVQQKEETDLSNIDAQDVEDEISSQEADIQNENMQSEEYTPRSPVFNAQDHQTTVKSYDDIDIRPYHSNYDQMSDKQISEDNLNTEAEEHELVENDKPDDYDYEDRQDYYNKIRLNQLKELVKMQKRKQKAQHEHVERQADSFNQSLSGNYNYIHNTEPVNKHKEQTDVVQKTDTNQNVEVENVYDTVIDEQIFQSETGVIKRKFYKRVIKSSPTKRLPLSPTSRKRISPGKRSFTVETSPKKQVSNLVRQLNHNSSPKPKSPISKNADTTPRRRSSSVDSATRKRSYAKSSDQLSDKINMDQKPKSPKHTVDQEQDSEQIDELMNKVEDELNEKANYQESFIKDHTRRLKELELIKEYKKRTKRMIQEEERNHTPQKIKTPTKKNNLYDSSIANEKLKNLINNNKSDTMSRHDFLDSSINRSKSQ